MYLDAHEKESGMPRPFDRKDGLSAAQGEEHVKRTFCRLNRQRFSSLQRDGLSAKIGFFNGLIVE